MTDFSTFLFLPAFLAAACMADLRTGRIPNGLIAAGLAVGTAGNCFMHGLSGFRQTLCGAFIPLLLLWVLFRFRMIGAGDIKLLCAVGSFLGPYAALRCTAAAFLAGGVISAVLLIKRRNLYSRFLYFFSYIGDSLAAGKAGAYLDGVDESGRFCFSVPITGAVLLHLGGVY